MSGYVPRPSAFIALAVLGTRPEAIKLAPVIAELRRTANVTTRVCVTGQHREMLAPLLEFFSIEPEFDLKLMTANQPLSSLTAAAITRIGEVIEDVQPDWLLVQGDTTTSMAATLAGFYRRVRIAHVEAGLRTYDLARPFPEEANRRIVDLLANAYFAPTARAKRNLLGEGIDPSLVHVTGNTGIDALLEASRRPYDISRSPLAALPLDRRIILVTAHRRESFGTEIRQICRAIRVLADSAGDVHVVYPVHLNPNVQNPVRELLSNHQRISLIPPLDYLSLVQLMRRATLILTDSGGIQEEAPTFGKPVLVLRDVTERPEAIEAGCAKIVGTDPDTIIGTALQLLADETAYARMAHVENPFGDGHASERIVRVLSGLPSELTEARVAMAGHR